MCATINFSNVREFNAVANNSKKQVSGIFKSPFVILTLLNKAYKGDVSAMNRLASEQVNISDFKTISAYLKQIHKSRYPFDYDYLLNPGSKYVKDSKNRLCTIKVKNSCPVWGYDLLNVSEEGWSYLEPVPLTIPAYYNAFLATAKGYLTSKIKADKQAQKAKRLEDKKRERLAKAKKVLTNIIGETAVSLLTDIELLDKYEIIRRAK